MTYIIQFLITLTIIGGTLGINYLIGVGAGWIMNESVINARFRFNLMLNACSNFRQSIYNKSVEWGLSVKYLKLLILLFFHILFYYKYIFCVFYVA